jgi:hypothetical protein
MRTVTVATHSERYFPELKRSAQRLGYHLDVLEWGMKWRGFAMKLLLRCYVASLHPEEIVLFVDGFDVVLLALACEMEKRFAADGRRIVFNCQNLELYSLWCRYFTRRFFRSSTRNDRRGYVLRKGQGTCGSSSTRYAAKTTAPVCPTWTTSAC